MKTAALLPEFPAVTDIRLTNDVTEDKVYYTDTFARQCVMSHA